MKVTPSTEKKTTLQSLAKIPSVSGLYRHENGTYYGKKKVRGVKKVTALTTADGQNISERKLAEKALAAWFIKLEKPVAENAAETFGEWLQKLKDSLKNIRSEGTQKKMVWVRRGFEMDGPEILAMPIALVKPLHLGTFFANRAKSLDSLAFNDMSRIVKNVFELAVENEALEKSPYDKVKKNLRRMKVTREPADVPTIEQCEQICAHVRAQQFADTAEASADFLEFLHKAALGTAEAVSADWAHVLWEKGIIKVKRQKTGEYFEVPIYAHLEPFLRDLHKRQGEPTAGALFSIKSPKVSLYNACKRLGLKPFSPIDLRKARITWMLRDKAIPVEVIAGWQGHKDNGVLIRRTYSWVKTTADQEQQTKMLAKLAA